MQVTEFQNGSVPLLKFLRDLFMNASIRIHRAPMVRKGVSICDGRERKNEKVYILKS